MSVLHPSVELTAESAKSVGAGESGGGVQSLQRASSLPCAGVALTTGIYTQEVIATVREKKRLDI
jgi:hypothetical protein